MILRPCPVKLTMPILGGKITKLAWRATLSQTTDWVASVSGQHLTRIPWVFFPAGASHNNKGGVGQELWPWTTEACATFACAWSAPGADCWYSWCCCWYSIAKVSLFGDSSVDRAFPGPQADWICPCAPHERHLQLCNYWTYAHRFQFESICLSLCYGVLFRIRNLLLAPSTLVFVLLLIPPFGAVCSSWCAWRSFWSVGMHQWALQKLAASAVPARWASPLI